MADAMDDGLFILEVDASVSSLCRVASLKGIVYNAQSEEGAALTSCSQSEEHLCVV